MCGTCETNVCRATMALTLFLLGGTLLAVIPSQQAYAQSVTFGTPKEIVSTATTQDSEPPSINRSGKNVYIVWHEMPNQDNQPDIYISRSTNSGNTFGQGRNISNTLAIASDQEHIAASEKNVYVVWIETDPLGQPQVVFSRSTNQGASFSSPPKTLSNGGNPTNPRVAASGKTVFVAWQADGQNGNPDIYVVKSSDAGTNFTTPIENISQNDGVSEFRDIGLHQIALAGDKLVVTWRDNSTSSGLFETFFAREQ